MRVITTIAVHCTASNKKAHDNIESIRTWHVSENGWNDIGYHHVILQSGKLEFGRRIERAGAHIRGHNAYSIGIALTGLNYFSENQMETLYKLSVNLVSIFDIKEMNYIGHNELDKNKTCPNFNLNLIKEMIYGRKKRDQGI